MQLNKERISLEPIVRRYEGQETLKSNHSRRSLSINPKIKTYNLKGRNIPFINHCKPSSIRSINYPSKQCSGLIALLKPKRLTQPYNEYYAKRSAFKVKPNSKRRIVSNNLQKNLHKKMELIYITPVIRNPKLMQGLTGEELEQRRESHLNTYFNARKNKLKEITKVNKKIYVRINSQKSLYSSRDLDKSYESTSQLSRRLSQSKLSRNSNTSLSRVSSRAKKARPSKVEKKVIIYSRSINQLYGNEVNKYMHIFAKKLTLESDNSELQNKYPRHSTMAVKPTSRANRTLELIAEYLKRGSQGRRRFLR